MRQALIAFVVVLAAALSSGCKEKSQVQGIVLREVKPLLLVLNPKPGVTERHVGLQAHFSAAPNTEPAAMTAFAEQWFSDRLRKELSTDPAANVAFLTFYLGPAVMDGQQVTKTFRVVYQLVDGEWQHKG